MEKTFKEKLASLIYDFLEENLEEQLKEQSKAQLQTIKELENNLTENIQQAEDVEEKITKAKEFVIELEAINKEIEESKDRIEVNQNTELVDVFLAIMKNSSTSCSYMKATYDISLYNVELKE